MARKNGRKKKQKLQTPKQQQQQQPRTTSNSKWTMAITSPPILFITFVVTFCGFVVALTLTLTHSRDTGRKGDTRYNINDNKNNK